MRTKVEKYLEYYKQLLLNPCCSAHKWQASLQIKHFESGGTRPLRIYDDDATYFCLSTFGLSKIKEK